MNNIITKYQAALTALQAEHAEAIAHQEHENYLHDMQSDNEGALDTEEDYTAEGASIIEQHGTWNSVSSGVSA